MAGGGGRLYHHGGHGYPILFGSNTICPPPAVLEAGLVAKQEGHTALFALESARRGWCR